MNTPTPTTNDNNNILEQLESELKESLAELRSVTATPADQKVRARKMNYERILVEVKARTSEKKRTVKPMESLRIDCDAQEGNDSSVDSGFSSPDSPVGNTDDGFFGSSRKLAQTSPSGKKSPFEQYSRESAFRQRAVSECVAGSPNRRGILKMPSVDDVTHRVKRVSICEENNQLMTFNPALSLDQQASQRRKNEKKRLQKQRKASERDDRDNSVDPICSDLDDEHCSEENTGKRSNRQDSGFISDDESDKICA